jgi:hypothetical protein
MGTKGTIRFQEQAGDLPSWTLYTELFENEDTVYLELEGVKVYVIMLNNIWGPPPGTVVLRLPTVTARQRG